MQVVAALRERGIYAFPDGTQVVACTDASGYTVLYYLTDWKLFGGDEVCAEHNAAPFRIFQPDPANIILRLGRPTSWNLDDLSDTGHTAHNPPQLKRLQPTYGDASKPS